MTVSQQTRIGFHYDSSGFESQYELAHVRQQTGGAVSMLPQEGELAIDPDERLEREAEQTAEQVMRGGTIGVQRMRKSEVHVQRMEETNAMGGADLDSTHSPGTSQPSGEFDTQAFLEQVVSEAGEIDWVNVLRKGGFAAAKGNAVTSALLAMVDETHTQMRDDSVEEGGLISHIQNEEGYDQWVTNDIAPQLEEHWNRDMTGQVEPRDLTEQ